VIVRAIAARLGDVGLAPGTTVAIEIDGVMRWTLRWTSAAQWHVEADPNPCATIVLAHLDARATRNDPEARARAKLALARRLYRLGYDREQIIRLFRFIDWLLRLPPELEDRTWSAIRTFEEEQHMTYITYGEQLGLAQGRAEGLQEGIAAILELKFGEAGSALLPEIREITDSVTLRAVLERSKIATTLDEVRAVYAPGE
jgi:hypothetical protein